MKKILFSLILLTTSYLHGYTNVIPFTNDTGSLGTSTTYWNYIKASTITGNAVNFGSMTVYGTVTSSTGFKGGSATFTYVYGDGSNLTGIASGGLSSISIYDEGTFQGNVSSFNIVGAAVSASVTGGTVTITVTATGGGGGGGSTLLCDSALNCYSVSTAVYSSAFSLLSDSTLYFRLNYSSVSSVENVNLSTANKATIDQVNSTQTYLLSVIVISTSNKVTQTEFIAHTSTNDVFTQGFILFKSTGELSDERDRLFLSTGQQKIDSWTLSQSTTANRLDGFGLFLSTGESADNRDRLFISTAEAILTSITTGFVQVGGSTFTTVNAIFIGNGALLTNVTAYYIHASSNMVLSSTGQITLNTDDRTLELFNGTTQVAFPTIKIMQGTFDLKSQYSVDPDLWLVDLHSDNFPHGIYITKIYVDASVADPTTELNANLNYCDMVAGGAFPGANATLIKAIDTTTGNFSNEAVNTPISKNKTLYITMDADPTDSNVQYHVMIHYYIKTN